MGDFLSKEERIPEICGQIASKFAINQIPFTKNPERTRKEREKAIKMGYEDGFCPRPECGRFFFAHDKDSYCDCNINNTKTKTIKTKK